MDRNIDYDKSSTENKSDSFDPPVEQNLPAADVGIVTKGNSLDVSGPDTYPGVLGKDFTATGEDTGSEVLGETEWDTSPPV